MFTRVTAHIRRTGTQNHTTCNHYAHHYHEARSIFVCLVTVRYSLSTLTCIAARGERGLLGTGREGGCQQNPAQKTKFKVQRPNCLARRRAACSKYASHDSEKVLYYTKYSCEDAAASERCDATRISSSCDVHLKRVWSLTFPYRKLAGNGLIWPGLTYFCYTFAPSG